MYQDEENNLILTFIKRQSVLKDHILDVIGLSSEADLNVLVQKEHSLNKNKLFLCKFLCNYHFYNKQINKMITIVPD